MHPKHLVRWIAVAGAALLMALPVGAQTLRIGLLLDPDALDPATSRTFVGRMVLTAMCDRLFDIDASQTPVPQLAASSAISADRLTVTLRLRPGVSFQDGEPFDAAAVKFNIERGKTLPGSGVRGELSAVSSVEVVDRLTVRLHLAEPYAPLLATLADRAGMMVSPKAAQDAAGFARKPVCAGPFAFSQRVAQDRIVLERFANYWNKAAVHFDKVVFLPIPDSSVRLANLRSGQLDLVERVAPTDIGAVRKDPRFTVATATSSGYQGLTINIGSTPAARSSVLARDPRIREAFELALDRPAIALVAMDGEADAGNQWVPPSSRYYARNVPIPKRDLARARALLKEAGVTAPTVTLMLSTSSEAQRIGQIVQAMVSEAGFIVKLKPTEFATAIGLAVKGDFEIYNVEWSGRSDPDGNSYSELACKQPLNYSAYCNGQVDDSLLAARKEQDPAVRLKAYEQAAAQVARDRPIIYLFHRHWLWAHTARLAGFQPTSDGLIRVQGLRLQ